jgi:hypothetical protein
MVLFLLAQLILSTGSLPVESFNPTPADPPAIMKGLGAGAGTLMVAGQAALALDFITGYNVVDHIQGHQGIRKDITPNPAPFGSTNNLTASQVASVQLNTEVGAALAAASQASMLLIDPTRDSRYSFVVTEGVCFGAFATMEVVTYGQGSRDGHFKATQVLGGMAGATAVNLGLAQVRF